MIFPNKFKLDNALFNLIARLEKTQHVLFQIIAESRPFDPILGQQPELDTLAHRGSLLLEHLKGFRLALEEDRVSIRDVNARIGKAKWMVDQQEAQSLAFQQARSEGQRLVDRFLKD